MAQAWITHSIQFQNIIFSIIMTPLYPFFIYITAEVADSGLICVHGNDLLIWMRVMSLTWFPASVWYLSISDSVFPKSFHAMNFKYCMHERYSSPVRFLGLWCNYYHAVFHQALPGSQISVAVAYKRFKHGFFSFTYRKYIKVHVHRYENLLIPKHRLGTRFSSCSKL